jgi:hypothetical protein
VSARAPQAFRERARIEADRYGPDPWIFVRELLQNGRDAGATRITITVFEGPGWAKIRCRDDGEGMSFEHARRYLFSLYASSKEENSNQVGRFGVGFWSILRFDPERIVIRSRCGDDPAWEVTLDGQLENARRAETSMGRGTEIVLERESPEYDEHGSLVRRVFDAAHQNGRFLCMRDDPERALSVEINGRAINEPFQLPAPSARFVKSRVRGVVGLGSAPRVELFSRGLRVRSAACLDDLLTHTGHTAHSRVRFPELPGALAPQALLESDGLDLLLSRNDARDTRTLRRLVELANTELRHLVERQIDEIHPPGALERLAAIGRRLRPESTVARSLVGAGVGACLALGIARLVWPASLAGQEHHEPTPGIELAGVPSVPTVAGPGSERYGDLARRYKGPQVSELDPSAAKPVQLRYTPRDARPYFAALLIDAPGAHRESIELSRRPYDGVSCSAQCIGVELEFASDAGPLVLPVPTGHAVDPKSVRVGTEPTRVAGSELGEPVIILPRAAHGTLHYRTGPLPAQFVPLSDGQRTPLPPPLAAEAVALSRLPVRDRVETAIELTRARVVYDTGPRTSLRHQRALEAGTPFIERALEIGAGDCDVQNGVLVALLHEAGVPARLAVGFVGVDGAAAPWMHAWVEFIDADGNWRIADTTAGASAAGGPVPLRPPDDAVIAPRLRPAGSDVELEAAVGPSSPSADAELGGPGVDPRDHPQHLNPLASDATSIAPGIDTEPPDSRDGGQLRAWIDRVPWAIPAGLALVLLMAMTWLIRLARRTRRELEVESTRDISSLLQGALQQPAAFRQLPALFHRRIIPLRNGKLTSLVRARARAGAGRLYSGAEFTDLSRRAVARGVPVLDAESPEGRTVASSLGATDLDHWGGLLARAEVTPILETLNLHIRRAGEPWQVRAVARLEGEISTLDLEDLGWRDKRRVVLLNAGNPWLVSATQQLEQRPAAAIFALLDYVVDHLGLDAHRRARLLSERAAAAMAEAARTGADGGSRA